MDKYDGPMLAANHGSRRFHIMIKPAGSACNLDCKYCFYLSKETLPGGPGAGTMSDETLELFIRHYIAGVTGPEIVFSLPSQTSMAQYPPLPCPLALSGALPSV